MVTLQEMRELVAAHAALGDMQTAIWIRREDREAWLVEQIDSLDGDDHPERPVAFNEGRSFRHALNLIASNREGLEQAIVADAALARAIADGVILFGDDAGNDLRRIAAAAHVHAG